MVNQSYGGSTKTYTSSADQNKKIFLGGLSYNTTDETLRAFCSRFGKMTDCVVMRTPEGRSRGFGFVTFEDSSSVEDFMRARPHTIDNRLIDTKRAMPREDQNSAESHLTVKKLFVGGLRDGIDETSLRTYFGQFGNITEVLMMNDRDGKPRGFAFISFDDYDAVDKIILEKPHNVNGRTLDVKKAVPKEKMQDISTSTGANNAPSSFPRNDYPSGPNQGNNFGPMGDNFNTNTGGWDSQSQGPNYGQQGYNSNTSGFNPPMPPNAGGFPPSYNSGRPNQPSQSMMNYNNPNPNMPFNNNNNNNNNLNQPPNSNYMSPSGYGTNQPQGYGTNTGGFNNMNNPFNLPPQQNNTSGLGSGYNNLPPMPPNPFDNSNSYNNPTQNYNNNNNMNYGEMPPPPPPPQQQSRGGGPMRGKRGRGGNASGNFAGNNNPSSHGNRSAPYSARGGRGGANASGFGGRGRGRGQ